MRRALIPGLCSIVLMTGLSSIAAGASPDTDEVSRFVDSQTFVVVRVDLDKLDIPLAARRLRNVTNVRPEDWSREEATFDKLVKDLRAAGVYELFLTLGVAQPARWIAPIPTGQNGEQIAERFAAATNPRSRRPWKAQVVGDAVVVSNQAEAFAPATTPASADEMAKAFAAFPDAAIQIALLLSPQMRLVANDFLAEIGGVSTRPVTDGFEWGAVGITLPPNEAAFAVRLQARDQQSAEALREFSLAAISMVRTLASPLADDANDRFFDAMRPSVDGTTVSLRLTETDPDADELRAGLANVAAFAIRHARCSTVSGRLKQIVLAMHNYHDAYGSLPPQGNAGPDGRMLLSWRVHLLPFLEQRALYEQFRLDEPWDSEHNRKLIDRMPAVFEMPATSLKSGETLFQAPGAPGTVIYGPTPKRFRDVTDGLSMTAVIIACPTAKPVIWTKPDDLNVDLEAPLKTFGSERPDLFVGVADGSTRYFGHLSPETISRLMTIDDGHPVEFSED